MDEVFQYILAEAGHQYLALVMLALWLVWKTNVVQFLTGVRASERIQLSHDQQNLVDDLRKEVDRVYVRMDEERDEHAKKIQELRVECEAETAKLRDQVAILITGESRWRHLTGNLASYVYALQRELRKVGVEVPRFGGWDKFIEDGGDPLIAFPVGEW